MFKEHSSGSYFLLLLLSGLLWSCNIEQISSDLDPTEISGRMGEDGCQVRIIGKVVSTQDLLGIEGATINSSQFPESIETDEDGNFQIDFTIREGESLEQTEVEVELSGYITNTFPIDLSEIVNLGDCSLLTALSWDIGLTPLEDPVEVRSDRPTSILIEDVVAVVELDIDEDGNIVSRDTVQQVNKYRIDIPKVIASQPSVLSITPNHNFAYGASIVRGEENRAEIAAFHFEVTDGTRLNGSIKIVFQSETAINTGDVINFSNDRTFVVAFDTNTDILTVLTSSFEDLIVYNDSNTFNPNTSSPFAGADGVAGTAVGIEDVENCNCGDPITYVYAVVVNSNTQINVGFPVGTSVEEQNAVYQDLREFLNLSADGEDISLTLPIVVDMCQVVSIATLPTGTIETGTIYGYPYTYQTVNGGNVDISTSICPTTSACHQGCP